MFFFKNRRKRNEVNAFMRRLVDCTTPAYRHQEELRREQRASRSLPVLLVPFVDGQPDMQLTAFGVTKDLSSQGVAVLTQRPMATDTVAIGFWHEDYCEFIQAETRYRRPVVGGYWQIGLLLQEVLHRGDYRALAHLGDLADRLTTSENPTEFEAAFATP